MKAKFGHTDVYQENKFLKRNINLLRSLITRAHEDHNQSFGYEKGM
jgi:hypothetical protein